MRRQSILTVLTGVALALLLSVRAFAASTNITMPAYYDDKVFTVNFQELPPGGEAATLGHNGSINTIYMSDQAAAEGFDFVAVLDAIQGDGFNPLWQEVQITFDTIPPQQFTSDNDILAAAALGEITLTATDEVYRCSVIGPKKK